MYYCAITVTQNYTVINTNMDQINISLTPTQQKFVLSKKHISVLIGGQGEGKSWAAVAAMLHHAHQIGKQINGCVIRDKFTNIERNTLPTIQKMLGGYARFQDGGRRMICPELRLNLFGIDDLASMSNLQGSENAIVWVEEPAPIYEVGNAGLREEVFDLACARGPREIGQWQRILISMNPASEDHWSFHRFIENPTDDMAIFHIPYGENPYLPSEERDRTKKAFAGRPDLYKRYVEGKFSFVTTGMAVTPEYREDFHRSQKILIPNPTLLTYRFWDGWLYPACVIGQLTNRGRFVVFDTLRGENMGMTQFVKQYVVPLVNQRYIQVPRWRDIGDPNIANPDQSDSEKNAGQIINTELHTSFEAGTPAFGPRREALKEALSRNVDGLPLICLSRNEGMLHRALRGGWHYNVNASGKITSKTPEKDLHSAPGDAFSYGIEKIFTYQEKGETQKLKTSKLGKSYATQIRRRKGKG